LILVVEVFIVDVDDFFVDDEEVVVFLSCGARAATLTPRASRKSFSIIIAAGIAIMKAEIANRYLQSNIMLAQLDKQSKENVLNNNERVLKFPKTTEKCSSYHHKPTMSCSWPI